MQIYEIDEELLRELFPDLDFTFTDEFGHQIPISNKKKRMKKKKKNLEEWIENQKFD